MSISRESRFYWPEIYQNYRIITLYNHRYFTDFLIIIYIVYKCNFHIC